MADEFTLELNNPLTEEEWDLITDVDLDNTPRVMFHTKHGKDVEYVKVKHGRWEGDGQCSVCKDYPLARYMKNPNYCPNCGARMDEVEE